MGKLCMEANFVNICERSRQEICRIDVLGKQYVHFNFVNICECFLDNCMCMDFSF